jgi:photosystem II stability/assembly factor-like uncharacterized protein/Cdc6-like AAA superfamily ATPase
MDEGISQSMLEKEHSPRRFVPRVPPHSWGIAALLVFAVSTFWAYQQPAWPDPVHPRGGFWAKVLYPLESNSFVGLPVMGSGLVDLSVPDENNVWVLSKNGYLLHSPDNGKSWNEIKLPEANQAKESKLTDLESLAAADAGLAVRRRMLEVAQSKRDENKKGLPNLSQKVAPQQFFPPGEQISPKSKTLSPRMMSLCHSVFFLDAQNGWIYGRDQVWATRDGGKSWKIVSTIGSENRSGKIGFVSPRNGWLMRNRWRMEREWIMGDELEEELELLVTKDGGESWSAVASEPFANKNIGKAPIYYQDAGRGVIAARLLWSDDGDFKPQWKVAVSSDCGDTWSYLDQVFSFSKAISINGAEIYRCVSFSDLQNGVVTSNEAFSGSLYITSDGGKSWKSVKHPLTGFITTILATRPESIMVAREGLNIQSSGNKGETWKELSGILNLPPMDMEGSSSGIWLLDDETLTFNRGQDTGWQRASNPVVSGHSSLTGEHQTLFVSTYMGGRWKSEDGGRSWERVVVKSELFGRLERPDDGLLSLAFLDKEKWCGISFDGKIFFTDNAGGKWTEAEKINYPEFIVADSKGGLHGFSGDVRADIEGSPRPDISYSGDGGRNWTSIDSKTVLKERVSYPPFFLDQKRGWFATKSGFFATVDEGRNWTRLKAENLKESICWIYFSQEKLGCVIDLAGTVYVTSDGGELFKEVNAPAQAASITMDADGKKGILLTRIGAVHETSDGGATWSKALNPPVRSLPLWYYAAVALSLLLLWRWKQKHEVAPPEQVEDVRPVLITDKPWTPGQPDYLQFGPVASGLTRFLRNPATDPPLTIAITGPWGSGKSSLMEMVRDQVKRSGFMPVWFNAWHHQKEEQLLAALVENIRRASSPSLFTLAGWEFRSRLLRIRVLKAWPLVLLGIFMLVFAGVWAWQSGPSLNNSIVIEQGLISNDLPGMIDKEGLRRAYEIWELIWEKCHKVPMLMFAITLAFNVYGLVKLLTVFGINPADLFATLSRRSKPQDFQNQTSFRHRFAQEFEEVTEALDKRSLLIFIDDLDRCQPETVVDMLEASNFLVSSGRVVIVMAMDRARVMRCVASRYKEHLDEDGVKTVDDIKTTAEKAQEFAQQYLEKIINIEVPVPLMQGCHVQDLLSKKVSQQRSAVKKEKTGWAAPVLFWMKIAERIAAPAIPWIQLACVGILAYYLAQYLVAKSPQQKQTVVVKQDVENPDRTLNNETPGLSPTSADRTIDDEREATSRIGYSPALPLRLGYPHWILGVGLLSALAAVLWWIARHPKIPLPRDSDRFVRALLAWGAIINKKLKTPRAIKRFENNVRFMAMQLRPEEETRTLLEQWADGPARYKAPAPGRIPDEILVAMAAIDLHFSGKLTAEGLKSMLRNPEFREIFTGPIYVHSRPLDADHGADTRLENLYFPEYGRIAGVLGLD